MKKNLLSMFALASMVFASSCSQEEVISQSTGNEVKVTFTTELRNDVKSRTVGDDTDNIDQLIFAVYDEMGNELPELRQSTHPTEDGAKKAITLTSDGTQKKATIEVVLVKGQTYSFAFWAQNQDFEAYTFDPETKEVSVSYDDRKANQREADAFFKGITNHKVTGTFTMDVTLKRPFSQVNFLTSQEDIINARKANFDPSQSKIVVKNVAKTLNVLTGEVSDFVNSEVTFDFENLLFENGAIESTEIHGVSGEWKYLATAYFLPQNKSEETKINATMDIKAADANKAITQIVATDITAQRNYRTNIYGKLLTSNGTFNVVVDPGFEENGDHNVESGVYDVTSSTLGTLLGKNKNLEGDLVYNVSGLSETASVSVEIPAGTKASSLTLNFTDVMDNATMVVENASNGDYAGTVILKNPADKTISQLTVDLPNAHVYLAQGNYTNVSASTSSSTLVIGSGASVTTLTVEKGNVRVEEEGEVGTIGRSENNPDPVTYVSFENEADIPTTGNDDSDISYVSSNEFDAAFVEKADGSYEIGNLLGLEIFRDAVNNGNTYSGKTIKLIADIDLKEVNWTTPIGTSEHPFQGTFDGNNKNIKNLTIIEEEAKEGKAYIGFFGYAKDVTIKNVIFENVNINIPCLDIDHSQGHIGAVVGSLEGKSTIENVSVKGDIKVEATPSANGASRVAVVAGGNSYGDVTIKDVHVIANEGSYLKANNNTGAIAGQLQGKTLYENCSSNIDVTVNKFFAGGIVGLAGTNDTFINCHTTGNIAVVAGREGRVNDHYRVGGIAGGWADGKNNTCSLTDCTYTGNVSGKNADGSVAESLDYMGFVGRGYTLANCAGSKVIIDGTEFVQVYNDKYGIYTINGKLHVANDADLIAYLIDGKDVLMLNDIVVPENTTITIPNGKTSSLDLNGKTLSSIASKSGNEEFFLVKGTLNIQNGTIEYKSLNNQGWNAMSTIFDITAGGIVNMNGVIAKNLGGTDMAFVAHLNNWGEATLNVNNSTLESTYIAVRAFNSGNDMNNITIEESVLNGKYCFWVHNYKSAGDNTGDDKTLNVNIYNKNNKFEYTGVAPVLYGFAKPFYFDEVGNCLVSTADEFIAALEAKRSVKLLNDIKIEPASMSNAYGVTGINVKYGQSIDGDGHTLNIKGAGGTWDSGINTTGGLIKNITVTGSYRGIFINHTSDYSEKVILENVTIGGNGTVYTISCDQGLYQGIEATNCTFNGWTSFAKTAGEAKFVNCSFGEGSGYKYCRPYSNTEFVNCTFCSGYEVDKTRATVTFTGCTWEE